MASNKMLVGQTWLRVHKADGTVLSAESFGSNFTLPIIFKIRTLATLQFNTVRSKFANTQKFYARCMNLKFSTKIQEKYCCTRF